MTDAALGEDFQFPRVTRHRIVDGRRTVPAAVEPEPGLGARIAQRLGRVVDALPSMPSLPSLRAPVLPQSGLPEITPLRAIGLAIGVTTAACCAVVAVYGGGSRAQAASPTIDVRAIEQAYPTGRDRVVVGRDGSLRAALFRAAVAPGDVDRILAEVESTGGGDRMRPGTRVDLVFGGRTPDDAYRQLQSATLAPRMDLALTVARVDGQLAASTRAIAIDHTPLRIYGAFTGSPRTDLVAAGVPDDVARAYLAALDDHVDVGTIVAGDRYDVIVEHAASAIGEEVSGSMIYAGLYQANGVDLRLSQWTIRGRLRWFDAREAAQSRDNIQRPVPGIVSSNFGPRRHPILGFTRMHKGMDFAAGYGTPILAVQTGWVETAGFGGGYGNHVQLRHGGGMGTLYGHMSRIVARPGTLVQQGEVIGYVGSTGLSTGPHLHYEVHQNGAAIDPSTIQFRIGPALSGSDLAGYQRRLTALLAVPARGSRRG